MECSSQDSDPSKTLSGPEHRTARLYYLPVLLICKGTTVRSDFLKQYCENLVQRPGNLQGKMSNLNQVLSA